MSHGAVPALWLNLGSLMQLTSAATYARALDLYQGHKVLSLEHHATADGWWLEGQVQGSAAQPYLVTAEFTRSGLGRVVDWDSDCSCPVSLHCKHAMALLIAAAHQGHSWTTAAPGITPTVRADPARQHLARQQEAENHLKRWLAELERSTGTAPRSLNPAPATQWASPRPELPEQLLYLLSVLNPQSASPQLMLEMVSAFPKPSGGWSKARPLRFQPERGQPIYDHASDADRDIVQLMRAMPSGVNYHYNFNTRSKVTLEGKFGLQLVQIAAATERLFVADANSQPGPAVCWGEPIPLRWEWQEIPNPPDGPTSWLPRARLGEGRVHLCLNNPPLYLDAAQGRCGLVDLQGMKSGWLAAMLRAPAVPTETLQQHHGELVTRLGPVPLPPVLEQVQRLSGIAPTPCLHVLPASPPAQEGAPLLQARLIFDYDGHRGWWMGQGSQVLVDGPRARVLLQRDPQAELEAVLQLRAMGWVTLQVNLFAMAGETHDAALELLESDFAALRAAGFSITQEDALRGLIRHARALHVGLTGQGPDDAQSAWFDLSLGLDIDGERRNILPWLPALLQAASRYPHDDRTGLLQLPPHLYVSDGQGHFVRLPTQSLAPWLAALMELAGERPNELQGDALRLSRLDALRATAALGEGAVWQGAEQLRAMLQRLHASTSLPDVAPPPSLRATLRPYQQQGLNWLQFLREFNLAGILADDMGLGKTLQTLAHIQLEKDAGRLTLPALIVVPVSLMGNWKREAERFCPNLRTRVHHGQNRHEAAEEMADCDLVIAPYSLLQRDRERWLKSAWHLVVLDEAQNIKNANTYAAEVAAALNARHRLCLSGTPMENNLGELWSLFHFLMPGFLGSQRRFDDMFRRPIEKQGDTQALQRLRARVTPFMLRRTKDLVAHELPPKLETVMRVELSGRQADLYETIRLGMEKSVREALQTKGLARSQLTILEALLKLRQVCCDPRLVKLDAARQVDQSAKLEQLMDMLTEMLAEGRRILLFSQFTSMLSLIEAELAQRGLRWVKLTGQSKQRDALIAQFTSGQVPLFLISLKAGGTGLNLPQADTVIHYDPWWNPAVENQASDRAHRIGQTQNVWVVRLVAQGTIEERILALQERKAALADSLYSGEVARKQPQFSEDDVAELLKPLSA